jgi:hypothetical protein
MVKTSIGLFAVRFFIAGDDLPHGFKAQLEQANAKTVALKKRRGPSVFSFDQFLGRAGWTGLVSWHCCARMSKVKSLEFVCLSLTHLILHCPAHDKPSGGKTKVALSD